MAANANEQNDLDAAEGLAYLNRIALQELPINREDEEMQRIAVNGPFDESILSRQFSSGKEAYRALQLESYHTTNRKGLYQLVSGKNVCKVVCMGDKDRIKWDKTAKQFFPIRPGVKLCSYRAHIGRVTKKGVAPHYIIDGNSNFRHNSHCQLRNCQRNTTVRRRKSSAISRPMQKARMSRTPLE